MQEYTQVTDQLRSNRELMAELFKYHDSFRNFIAILANHQCGVAVTDPKQYRPRFLYKCEGGVVVQNESLVLTESGVHQESHHLTWPTEEEKAVVAALDQVAKHILKEGSAAKGLGAALEEFVTDKDETFTNALAILIKAKGNPFEGDPWRNFFGEVWDKHVRLLNEEVKKAGKETRYF